MAKAKIVFLFTSMLIAAGCKSAGSQAELKYGHLVDADSPQVLLASPPGTTFSLCGDWELETVKMAILEWAKVLGRDRYLTVDTRCQSPEGAAVGSITRVYTYKYGSRYVPQDESQHNEELQGWKFGERWCDENPQIGAFALTRHKTIFSCIGSGDRTAAQTKSAILHEVGHLWGMCDQYRDYGDSDNNCDPDNRTTRDPNSVMGSMAASLTADDKAGIIALAKRRDTWRPDKWDGKQSFEDVPSTDPTRSDDEWQFLGSTSINASACQDMARQKGYAEFKTKSTTSLFRLECWGK